MKYYPEGYLLESADNIACFRSFCTLADAAAEAKILEAKALMCDAEHNLIVDLGCMRGIIPRNEGAIGIKSGAVRDIALISRVGKPVCFVVKSIETSTKNETYAVLSRLEAQLRCCGEYIRFLREGDIIPTSVTHLESFGAFCDIGCGISALLPIDSVSVSRINHPRDRFFVGEKLKTIVKCRINDRIILSLKELLGTWSENASLFKIGETVEGIIRSIESYGVFIELTPNLAGLAESRENIGIGETASVYIKYIIPEKMKVKLIIIDSFGKQPVKSVRYFYNENHIKKFAYSPEFCERIIETRFY